MNTPEDFFERLLAELPGFSRCDECNRFYDLKQNGECFGCKQRSIIDANEHLLNQVPRAVAQLIKEYQSMTLFAARCRKRDLVKYAEMYDGFRETIKGYIATDDPVGVGIKVIDDLADCLVRAEEEDEKVNSASKALAAMEIGKLLTRFGSKELGHSPKLELLTPDRKLN